MIVSISNHLRMPPNASGVHIGLARMAEAFDCADNLCCDVWQFALKLETVLSAGMSHSELRWLAFKGYVAHGIEVTAVHDTVRTFRAPPSCFQREDLFRIDRFRQVIRGACT